MDADGSVQKIALLVSDIRALPRDRVQRQIDAASEGVVTVAASPQVVYQDTGPENQS